MSARTFASVHAGCFCRNGAANDVPVPSAPATYRDTEPAEADPMFTPGATMSGFVRLSTVGPRLENHARNGPSAWYGALVGADQSAVAPTVIACTAAPGDVIVPGRSPPLP